VRRRVSDDIDPAPSGAGSSATRRLGGTVKPIALAVFSLMSSSNFAGACTGKGGGLLPIV